MQSSAAYKEIMQQPTIRLCGAGTEVLPPSGALMHANRHALYALDELRTALVPDNPRLPKVMEAR